MKSIISGVVARSGSGAPATRTAADGFRYERRIFLWTTICVLLAVVAPAGAQKSWLSWHGPQAPPDPFDGLFLDSASGWISSGFLYRTDDGGLSWKRYPCRKEPCRDGYQLNAGEFTRLDAVNLRSGSLISHDGGESWNYGETPADFSIAYALRGWPGVRWRINSGGFGRDTLLWSYDSAGTWPIRFSLPDTFIGPANTSGRRGTSKTIEFFTPAHGVAVMRNMRENRYTIAETRDSGRSWQPMHSFQCADPNDWCFSYLNFWPIDSTAFWRTLGDFYHDDTLFFSSDFGRTWSVRNPGVTLGDGLRGIYRLWMLDTLFGYAWNEWDSARFSHGGPQRVFRTTDGGRTWTAMRTGYRHRDPSGMSGEPNRDWRTPDYDGGADPVFIVDRRTAWIIGRPVQRTTDGGDTWRADTMPFPPFLQIWWRVRMVDTCWGWAVGRAKYALRTTDGGSTWNPVPAPQGEQVYFMNRRYGWAMGFRSPSRPADLYTDSLVYRTRDGGRTWERFQLPAVYRGTYVAVTDFHFFDPWHGFALMDDATLWETTDGGENWTLRLEEPQLGDRWSGDLDQRGRMGWARDGSGVAYVGLQQGRNWKTTDWGASWDTIAFPGYIYQFVTLTEQIGYASFNGSIYHTTDGWKTWKEWNTSSQDPNAIDLAVPDTMHIWLGQGARAQFSSDAGATWNLSGIGATGVSAPDARHVWVANDTWVYRWTTDSGCCACRVDAPEAVITMDAAEFGAVPIGERRTAPLRLTNAGHAPLRIDSIEVRRMLGDTSALNISNVSTVRSLAPGDSIPFADVEYAPQVSGPSMEEIVVWSNDAIENPIRVRVSGTAFSPTAVGSARLTPSPTRIIAAYPNPAGSGTRVEFALERSGTARLEIYDVVGRLVAARPPSRFAAGTHSALFATTALPDGIYYVRLAAGSRVDTVTLVVRH